MTVEEFLKNELNKLIVGLRAEELLGSKKSFMDLGLDSFGFIQFIQEIERTYGFQFSDTDILNPEIYSFSGLRSFIEAKLNK